MNPNDPLDDTQGSSVPPFLPEPGSAFARNSLLPAGGSVGGQYHQPQASDRYRSTGSYPAPEYTRPAAQPLPAYDSGYPGAYGGPGRAGEGLGYSVGPIGGSGLEGGMLCSRAHVAAAAAAQILDTSLRDKSVGQLSDSRRLQKVKPSP
ncbi:hypothetical protein DIPPA_10082 [Diplonema papillatum]|nr:hypothetical protein DIPPA_10082 [Diplonema papillatum]